MSKYILLLIIGVGLFLAVVVLLLLTLTHKPGTPAIPLAPSNKVVSVTPADGANDVSVNTALTIVFNQAIVQSNDLKLTFTPDLPNLSYTIQSHLPAKSITIKPRGQLATATTYQVTVSYQANAIYQFSFTTEATPPQQGDPESLKVGNELVYQDYPLLSWMPYQSQNLSADYISPHHLKVIVNHGTQQQAQQEITAFMKSHNIDPSTHQIDYVIQ